MFEWNYYSLQLLDEETKPVNFTCRLQRKSIEWTLNLALNTIYVARTQIWTRTRIQIQTRDTEFLKNGDTDTAGDMAKINK